jgi:cytochrome d ubiquinol oxidase subunit II
VDLNSVWFVLVGVLVTGYIMLDGFDLGTGVLLPLLREDRERRVFLNAIGPVWNGNEVWLVTAGGALFAAFPDVYATLFSGFYDAFMLLLTALIFRAAAIEFRGQKEETWWRKTWDLVFAGSSLTSGLILGIALGNFVWGIPIDEGREYRGGFEGMLRPFTLLSGFAAVALFLMHASIYLVMKTEGDLQARVMRWANITVPTYLVFFVVSNIATALACPHMEVAMSNRPIVLGLILVMNVVMAFNILREIRRKRAGAAFLSSCATIGLHMLLLGVAVYPTLIFSTPDHARDLTIYNSSSTDKTLRFMFIVAMIGVPIVLTYTATIYYVFRGKVVLSEESY